MKKCLKYFSLLLVLLVVVTGCGSKKEEKKEDPKVILENAMMKMQEVESASFEMDFEIGMAAEGTTITMDAKANGKLGKNKNVYMKMDMTMLGYTQSSETYATIQDGYEYTYTNAANAGWYYTKEETDATAEDSNKMTEEDIQEVLDMMSDVKEVKTDKEGYTKLVVTISKDKFTELMQETQPTDEELEVQIDKDFEMSLYVKDGYISIVEVDLSDMMSSAMSESDVPMDMTLKITFTLTDFNNVGDVIVPAEVIESAVPEEEFLMEPEIEPEIDIEIDTEV